MLRASCVWKLWKALSFPPIGWLLTPVLYLQISCSAFAVTIHQESFEAAPNPGVTYGFNTGGDFGGADPNDYFNRITVTNNSRDEIDTGVTGTDGDYMVGGEDTDGGTSPQQVTLVGVDVSSYTNVQVVAALGSGAQNKYDTSDFIKVQYEKNGAGGFVTIGAFYGLNFNVRLKRRYRSGR